MRLSTWSRTARAIVPLLCLLVGCSSQGSGNSGDASENSGDTTEVSIRIGQILHHQQVQQVSPAVGSVAQAQRAAGLPPDVERLFLHVTTNARAIPASPLAVSLETATVRLTLSTNRTYQLRVEGLNQRGMVVLQGETQVQLVERQPAMEVVLTLSPQETVILAAMQAVSALTGGEVVVTDPQSPVQGLRITIPPAALLQDTTVMVMEVSNPLAVPPPPQAAGQIVELMADGVTFMQPVALTFPYDVTLVQALELDETTLRIWRYNPTAGEWAPVPNQQLDTARHVITAQLTSFSLYTISGAPEANATNRPPVADNQVRTTPEDTALSLLLTGSDPDHQALTFHLLTTPSHGTLSGIPPALTYSPEAHFHGQTRFTFVVNDGTMDSAPATVTLNVTAVNDPPVVTTPLPDGQVTRPQTSPFRLNISHLNDPSQRLQSE